MTTIARRRYRPCFRVAAVATCRTGRRAAVRITDRYRAPIIGTALGHIYAAIVDMEAAWLNGVVGRRCIVMTAQAPQAQTRASRNPVAAVITRGRRCGVTADAVRRKRRVPGV